MLVACMHVDAKKKHVKLKTPIFNAVHFPWYHITYVKFNTNVLHNTFIC